MEKFFKLFIVFFAISTHCFSQNKSDLLVGVGIGFENIKHDKLFFDVDPLIKLQTFKNVSFFPGSSDDYTSVIAKAQDVNFQLAISPSINYKVFSI